LPVELASFSRTRRGTRDNLSSVNELSVVVDDRDLSAVDPRRRPVTSTRRHDAVHATPAPEPDSRELDSSSTLIADADVVFFVVALFSVAMKMRWSLPGVLVPALTCVSSRRVDDVPPP